MADFTIREAREDDCDIILEFIRALADYEKLLHEVKADAEDIRRELFGPTPAAHCVLACEGETPVGFALYFYNFSTFLTRKGLYLEDLYMAPQARGKGYGRAMIEYLARKANREGCGRFEWSVLAWNEPAIGFYEKMGAVVMNDWRICRLTGQALTRFGVNED